MGKQPIDKTPTPSSQSTGRVIETRVINVTPQVRDAITRNLGTGIKLAASGGKAGQQQ